MCKTNIFTNQISVQLAGLLDVDNSNSCFFTGCCTGIFDGEFGFNLCGDEICSMI